MDPAPRADGEVAAPSTAARRRGDPVAHGQVQVTSAADHAGEAIQTNAQNDGACAMNDEWRS
jgi:hypothetical protein